MASSLSSSSRALRRLASGVALVVALLVAFVGMAPTAHSWHSESFAEVECVDQSIVLQWRVVSWRGDNFWGPDYYNADARVYLQYRTDDAAIGAVNETQIGAGAFTDTSLAFQDTEVLSPPANATRVRVHSDALALWASGNATIPHESQTTPWLTLPAQCVEETTTTTQPETTTTTEPTTSTTEPTTSTTVSSGVTPTSAVTSSTTSPVGVLSSGASASGAAAQVVPAQAAPAQTLPNTGSSSGVLAAAAVLLIAVGGGLVATTRRATRPAVVRGDGSNDLG